MSLDVFMTYDKRDKALARALKAALTRAGLTSFAESEDLYPGDLWDEEIPKALHRARVILALVTPAWPHQGGKATDWYGSDKLTMAVNRAESQRRGAPLLVPIRMPGVADTQIPYGWGRTFPVEMHDGDDFDAVAERVRGTLERRAAKARQTPVLDDIVAAEGDEREGSGDDD